MSKYSKFWPKGGLPGILHHYVSALLTFISYASGPQSEQVMPELMSAPTANIHAAI